jgi:hypothetical protein
MRKRNWRLPSKANPPKLPPLISKTAQATIGCWSLSLTSILQSGCPGCSTYSITPATLASPKEIRSCPITAKGSSDSLMLKNDRLPLSDGHFKWMTLRLRDV